MLRYSIGKVNTKDAASELANCLMDFVPLSPSGAYDSFVPDALKPIYQAYVSNKSFTSMPIAKITLFNEYDPEFKRVYKGTS